MEIDYKKITAQMFHDIVVIQGNIEYFKNVKKNIDKVQHAYWDWGRIITQTIENEHFEIALEMLDIILVMRYIEGKSPTRKYFNELLVLKATATDWDGIPRKIFRKVIELNESQLDKFFNVKEFYRGMAPDIAKLAEQNITFSDRVIKEISKEISKNNSLVYNAIMNSGNGENRSRLVTHFVQQEKFELLPEEMTEIFLF